VKRKRHFIHKVKWGKVLIQLSKWWLKDLKEKLNEKKKHNIFKYYTCGYL